VVLLVPGIGRIFGRFCVGYGWAHVTFADLRPRPMAYTLLQPMGDPAALLNPISGVERFALGTTSTGFF
jgi:hypothetical protein